MQACFLCWTRGALGGAPILRTEARRRLPLIVGGRPSASLLRQGSRIPGDMDTKNRSEAGKARVDLAWSRLGRSWSSQAVGSDATRLTPKGQPAGRLMAYCRLAVTRR